MTRITEKTLLETYKATLGEEQFFTTLFENRLSFYSGLLSSLITAIILGIFYAQSQVELIALLVGPVILIFISLNGINAAHRGSSRIYKIIVTRSKLEQALGLTQKQEYPKSKQNVYWNSEPIVDIEHLSIRRSYKTSQDFVNGGMKNRKNLYHQTRNFYYFFIALGIIAEIFIIFKIFQIL